jgi:hypothetical protein
VRGGSQAPLPTCSCGDDDDGSDDDDDDDDDDDGGVGLVSLLLLLMLTLVLGRHLGTQRVLAVSVGASHTAVLVASQSVLTFGNNEYARLTPPPPSTPRVRDVFVAAMAGCREFVARPVLPRVPHRGWFGCAPARWGWW